MDFDAELKTLQAFVKELQTENQGTVLLVATFIKIRTALFDKVSSNIISRILFNFSDSV